MLLPCAVLVIPTLDAALAEGVVSSDGSRVLLAACALLGQWRSAAHERDELRERVLISPADGATLEAVVLAEAALGVLHCKGHASIVDTVQKMRCCRANFARNVTTCAAVQR